MSKEKLLIDTDPGVDDAMAIFFACLHPDIDVVGLTGVFGNVTVDIATRNAIVLAERAKQDIPVARGAEHPLVQKPNGVSDYVHGEQGFGDMPAQAISSAPVNQTAAEFICTTINNNPGEIILCPIGPLTNIALALEHDPSIARKVKRVVLMGGSFRAGGNVSDYAEANIWNDPHAADAVFGADWPVVMVGLDATQKMVCTPEDFDELEQAAPILGGFLNEASDFYIRFYESVVGIKGCYIHDPAAIIAAIRPELFSIENHPIEVKLDGIEIGQTALSSDKSRREAGICVDVQGQVVKDLFMDTIRTGF